MRLKNKAAIVAKFQQWVQPFPELWLPTKQHQPEGFLPCAA
jgi:hypothetical protein